MTKKEKSLLELIRKESTRLEKAIEGKRFAIEGMARKRALDEVLYTFDTLNGACFRDKD